MKNEELNDLAERIAATENLISEIDHRIDFMFECSTAQALRREAETAPNEKMKKEAEKKYSAYIKSVGVIPAIRNLVEAKDLLRTLKAKQNLLDF